jgi:PAS domain S-box-containing protein
VNTARPSELTRSDLALTALAAIPGSAVLVLDHELRFALASGAALEAEGLRADRMEGRRLGDVLPSAAYFHLEPRVRAALAGVPSQFERPAGDRVHRYAATPLRDEDGAVLGALVVIRDVTREARAEAHRDRFESAFAHGPGASAVLDARGRVVEANAALCELLGRDEDALLGLHVDALRNEAVLVVAPVHDGEGRLTGHILSAAPREVVWSRGRVLDELERSAARAHRFGETTGVLLVRAEDAKGARVAERLRGTDAVGRLRQGVLLVVLAGTELAETRRVAERIAGALGVEVGGALLHAESPSVVAVLAAAEVALGAAAGGACVTAD